jgi:hypothetical protein
MLGNGWNFLNGNRREIHLMENQSCLEINHKDIWVNLM